MGVPLLGMRLSCVKLRLINSITSVIAKPPAPRLTVVSYTMMIAGLLSHLIHSEWDL